MYEDCGFLSALNPHEFHDWYIKLNWIVHSEDGWLSHDFFPQVFKISQISKKQTKGFLFDHLFCFVLPDNFQDLVV